jgi:GNAT superfamily N-acetyltransferase
MKPDLRFEQRSGRDITAVFPELARLRIVVFRDFPYLYEGTEEYEMHYLQTYDNAPNSLLFSVYDGDEMVGATTCIPLLDETPEVQKPFIEAGYDLAKVFYFGESVLLPAYRGLGLGHRFFDAREAHARSFGRYELLCFCAVVRPDDHPLKPAGYQPLDGFWQKRGYQKEPRLQSLFDWPDIGETTSTAKPMVYWTRQLT